MKIFIVWANYDGIQIEEFLSVESAEIKLSELALAVEKHSHGTWIYKVIKGEALEYKVVERVKMIEIVKE